MASRALRSVLVGCIEEEDLEFIRPICSALLKIDIDLIPDVNTLLTKMEQILESAILPSVWHLILSSVGRCAEEKLSLLEEYITHPYNINEENFEFGLMLTMTETVKEMDMDTFNNYKSNVGLPNASSKEKFLYGLYKENRLTRDSAPELRECIQTTGCLDFHEPLTVFCGEHNIPVPDIIVDYVPDSDEGSNDRNNDKKIRATCRFILCTCILITIILIMAAIALTFLFIYKNTQHFDAQNISVYNGYATSIYYDQFYVNEVNLISDDSSATASVYVVPKSQLSYIPVILPEKQIDKRSSTFLQRFELYYDRSENNLICNTICKFKFRFELQQNGDVSGCPAQLFLYDNKADLKVFKDNEPSGSVGDFIAKTECLPETGVVNKTFYLPPNRLYYIGWYVAKNVGYTIWLSANLTRINISGLNENCSVSSQHTTCPITHARYPHRNENISLLFNTTSATMMGVNVTPVLVQWNLQRLTGVSVPSCIGAVALMVAVSVLFYYCIIRPVARSGYSTIA